MAGTDEFHHGLRFKRLTRVGPIEVYDSTTLGYNLTAPDADPSVKRNEPFLMTKDDLELRDKLGATGTARKYTDAVFDRVDGAMIVANIFEEGGDQDATLANAIGDQTAQSGLFALETAEGYLGIKPKILATPGYTHFRVGGAKNPVLNDQGLIAKRMGAVHISGTPATTEEAAVEFRGDVDDPRLILFDQMVKTKDGLMTPEGHVAAVGIQTDKEVGYHASWGNKVLNVLGVNRAVPYHMTDSDSRANYLMSNQVNCIINHQGGWRTWGDYAATTDTSLRFYCQLRVDDIVNEALARTIWRVVSDPLVADKVTAVLDRMNQFFGAMVEDGKLIGGEAFFYGDRNSIGALELGKIVLSYDSFSPPPITLIDIEHQRQPRYLEVTVAEILAQTNFAAAA
ncbi:hypothetical protein [Roseibium sp.]|uniref:hypothetical protein n=1 Tax=Roseibium sp. TaxID=1936156 RepID=UPI003D0EF488